MNLATTHVPGRERSRRIWLGDDATGWLDLGAYAQVDTVRAALHFLAGSPRLPADRFDVATLPDAPDLPIDADTRILCVGLNFRSHIQETGGPEPARPSLFARFPSSFVAHGAPIVAPRVSDTLDWEGEPGVVVGRAVSNATARQALEAIAGFTVVGEHSVREFQRHTAQVTAGKNFDASGAIGPWIALKDSLPSLDDETLTTWVNGERVQHASLSDLLFTAADLIVYISSFMQLRPGDVVALGTPAGVGTRMTPPRYLKPGDEVVVSVSNVGVLRNPVTDKHIQHPTSSES